MARGTDDDALAWDGDDDPTLDPGSPVALPKGYTAVGRDSATVGRVDSDGTVTMPSDREPMGNAALIATGVLGGVYVLWAVGWLIGGLRLQGLAQFLVSPVGYLASLVMAILAPLIWFTTVFLLTRGERTWLRFVWLAAGVILLLPWPFVMVGAVGQ